MRLKTLFFRGPAAGAFRIAREFFKVRPLFLWICGNCGIVWFYPSIFWAKRVDRIFCRTIGFLRRAEKPGKTGFCKIQTAPVQKNDSARLRSGKEQRRARFREWSISFFAVRLFCKSPIGFSRPRRRRRLRDSHRGWSHPTACRPRSGGSTTCRKPSSSP